MHIAFFQRNPSDFNPNMGGVQRIVRLLESGLSSNEVKVSLISGSAPNVPSDDVIYLTNEKLISEENIQLFKEVITAYKIDCIINEDALDFEVLALLKHRPKDVKLISVHNNCVKCLEEQYENIFRANRGVVLTKAVDLIKGWSLIRFLFRTKMKRQWIELIKSSDAIVVYFDEFKKEIEELICSESEKVFTIANPSSFEIIKREKLYKKIIYVGRIEKNQKRIDKLLSLWKSLHEDLPDWDFDLIGDGSYMNQVKKYIDENNLTRVTIHGWQDPLKFWDQADIFTLTSDFEGYGMVITEAQARGVIPVSFKCYSAIEEVIGDGASGILIDDFDLDKMRSEIVELAKNNGLIKKFKSELDSNLDKFKIDTIAKQWLNLIKSI